ncbi:NnrU family protein [Bermanella sp. WJH001]|uniref:NnrU family protein n=1 Tax=Bermanella sp. WJH001 TaxID=3048005 RepID=UPI0024BD9C71|nr:NnrU family protein [Bermanella sp. WJH001]MDJ1536711.1 NnrU family protein [Bermanella sp. WJH001]
MEWLILGITLFFGIHLLPLFNAKQILLSRIGKAPYMIGFSLISALGLGLMIYGKASADFVPIWQPIAGAHWVAIICMWPAAVLFVWAEIPCSMRSKLKHPMLLGITLFASSHLVANGDLASILLFMPFALYAIFTMFKQGFKNQDQHSNQPTPGLNIFGILLGSAIYALVFTFHQHITGMVIPI